MLKSVLFSIITVLSTLATFGQEADTRFIREDRLWEYVKSTNSLSADFKTTCTGILTYRFDGVETHYGKEYHRCVLDKAELWQEVYDRDQMKYEPISEVTTLNLNRCVGLVREEGQKVYILPDDRIVQICSMPYETIGTIELQEGKDLLLFDFSVSDGEVFNPFLMSKDNGPMIAQASVWVPEPTDSGLKRYYIGNLVPADLESRWKYFDRLKITVDGLCIEGIGNVGEGEMLRYGGTWSIDIDAPAKVPSRTDENWMEALINNYSYIGKFNNYSDLDGNILYPGKGIKVPDPSSVRQIVDSEESDSPLYDIMGRQGREMVPGSVYIRGGKKFVAK